MAKKKIKDMTIEELEKICDQHRVCNNCPLDTPNAYYKHCMKNIITDNKEYLEKEIEVEDDKEEN